MLCEKSLFYLKPLILQGQKLRSQQKPHGAQEQISGFLVQIVYQGAGSSGVGFTLAHSTSEPPLPLSPLFCEFRPATWPQGESECVSAEWNLPSSPSRAGLGKG